MNKILLTTGLTISTLFFSVGQVQAGTLDIDSFNTQWQSVEVKVPLPEGEELPSFPISDEDTSNFSLSIVGGYRNVFVEMINAQTFLSEVKANVVPEIAVDNGLLSISNDDGVESRTILTWDNRGNDLDSNGLGIDMLNTGVNTDAFNLNIVSIDLNADLIFTVMGNNGETATLSRSGINTIGDNLFSYEDFTVSNGTHTDIFSNVKSIALEVSGADDLDVSFDSISAVNTDSTVVPESTSVLSLLSIIGFGAGFCAKGKFRQKF
jgi:hypothetical protein